MNSLRHHSLRVLCCLLVFGSLLLAGCGYGEISPLSYEYAKALYGICNRRDAKRLDDLRGQIATALEKQEITDRESDWFADLIAQAESGEWQEAAEGARQMMEDQAGR